MGNGALGSNSLIILFSIILFSGTILPLSNIFAGIEDLDPPITTITGADNGDESPVPILANEFTPYDDIAIYFEAIDGEEGSGVDFSECRKDSTAEEDYVLCESPVSYMNLVDGEHTVEIRSTDLDGNVEETAIFTWSIDTTPPSVTFTINENSDRTFSRSVTLDTICDDDVIEGVTGSGCGTFFVGGIGVTDGTDGESETFDESREVTLTAYRGVKTVEISLVTDNVGNVAEGSFSDTIALDPRIVNIIMSDDGDVATDGNTPFWGVDATFTGTVENTADPNLETDTITFDFGSPTVTGISILDGDFDGVGTFSITDSYPQISLDSDNNPHEPSAKLVDSGGDVLDSTGTEVTTLGPEVVVQAHPTVIISDFLDNPNEGNRFFTGGRLFDLLFSVPITDKLISFEGDGSPTDLADYTTEGITFSDSGGIEIDACSTCSSPDNIMRLNPGATISPSEKTTYVGLHLRDMNSGTVTVRVTNGDTPPAITDYVATASPTDIVVFTLTDPFEIETIQILSISDSSTVGLSSVKTFGTELGAIHDIDFLTTSTGSTSLTFDEGRFYSEGTAQNTAEEFLDLDQEFAGDDDYLGTSSTVTYSVLESTTSGVGGSATVLTDSGKGISSILCSDDADGDALCDDWEGGAADTGVPFIVGATTYTYPLPGTSNGIRDVLVEIDSQTFHTPDTAALTNVVTSFSAEDVNLIHSVDDTTLPHINPIKLWTDTDLVDDNDFNSLKNDWFGTASERPTISTQSAQSNSVTPGITATATSHTITLSGISLSIPSNTITSGATQGNIIAKIKVTTRTAADVATTTTVTPGTIIAPASPVGLNLGTITALSSPTSTTGVKLLTVTIPFTTTGSIPTTVIPPIIIPITLPTAYEVLVATNPGSPQISTTLLDAKSQAYRYGIWAHSYGTSTSTPSGQSELKGNDFVVTLGAGYGGTLAGHTGSIGTTNEQAGTYAHEMGHILNLKHGGGDDINCKPNYFSIMSYSRQMATYLGGAWTLSFSPGGHSPLTETALPETGVNILGGTVSETAVYASPVVSPTSPTHTAPDHTFHSVAGNAASIDWNDSGSSSGTVSADINNFKITGCGATTPTATPYTDFDDSALMTFDFRSAPSGQLDGITIFVSDVNDNVRYQTLLASGTFDGLDSPVPNNKSKRGSTIPIKLDVTVEGSGVVDLPSVHGQVWVSTLNSKTGPYTKLTNQLTGTDDVVWDPINRQIKFNWKTPSNLAVGTYYLRVFLIDTEGGFVGGLGADPDTIPAERFLTDLIAPYKLPLNERTFATDKVQITK